MFLIFIASVISNFIKTQTIVSKVIITPLYKTKASPYILYNNRNKKKHRYIVITRNQCSARFLRVTQCESQTFFLYSYLFVRSKSFALYYTHTREVWRRRNSASSQNRQNDLENARQRHYNVKKRRRRNIVRLFLKSRAKMSRALGVNQQNSLWRLSCEELSLYIYILYIKRGSREESQVYSCRKRCVVASICAHCEFVRNSYLWIRRCL